MFTVETGAAVESVKQIEKWCSNREIRCPDGLGRELPVSLCVRTSLQTRMAGA
jgi:hypothetical protein